MPSGYTVNTGSLAVRVGELRAVASAVASAAATLEVSGGDLGPGDINAAIQEVAGQWRDGLAEMVDKIDTIAGNVDDAVSNYEQVETAGAIRFQQKYGM
jgi:hypothetical protein